jgi:tRNA nucleotidyltransferase (CCA-adding enzyme)
MSDYMFMLDSHLSGEQTEAVSSVRDAAEQAALNLFLTGGAMRDMMGGFPIRDLDFTIEGPALRIAKSLAETKGAEIISINDQRKSAEIRLPGNVHASISMAREERYSKPGSKPQIQPASIHDDLRGRDFTVNAIALSLGKASRGLLLDPCNGLGDLARKELRGVTNHVLYDDPSRILRLIRLRTRLSFTTDERLMAQYKNAREAKLELKIGASTLESELRQIAVEPLSGDIVKALDEEGLLSLFSPALAGAKLNFSSLAKLQKALQSVPYGLRISVDYYVLFLALLFEKLSGKERNQMIANVGLDKGSADAAQKLESRAAKFEKELAAAKINRPSTLYALLSKVPGEVLIYASLKSGQRIIVDRLKNYFQKYLPTAQEVTPQDVMEQGGQPGTAKFDKIYKELIAARLDARPKKPVIEEPPPPPPPPPGRRSASSFGR